ncbi:MAG: aspartate--tRNA ligase [Oscillospiraceae bacterium]|nr:aspartate--tRNA ligase [Oscillospiraceae bacterium]
MDTQTKFKRSLYCGEPRMDDVGRTLTVCGWAQRQRDLGGLIFIDLRDRTGLLQLAFDEETDRAVFEAATAVRSEYVLAATGVLRERSSKNTDIPTGAVELAVTELTILAKSETPPFEIIEDVQTGEAIRLKHRYLDLRRPDLQRNILLRHKVAKLTRDYFDDQGFIEIETPMLIRSMPEGARDYLVPSRIQPGKFYALPQSPQLYKQLSMVAGFDRYFQLVRCFRDEDLRADRQPEFTQVDLEMSFVDMDDVLGMVEGYMARLFREILGRELPLPLPRLTYDEILTRYGTDKPDLRYGMELFDLTDTVRGSEFGVFTGAIEAGGSVRGIVAKNAVDKLSRKEIDKLIEFIRGVGGKGIAWARLTADGLTSSFAKFMTEAEMVEICKVSGAETGDVILLIADGSNTAVQSQLGMLRVECAKRLGIIDETRMEPFWVVDFPYFVENEESGEYEPIHHAFTAPRDDCLDYLETDRSRVYAKAYDLVLNGIELASGSIRITSPETQGRIFDILGLTPEESQRKFGFLLDAFRYGAPPHGGMALGLDRIVMLLTGAESLRDVIAFPKLKDASEAMTACPDVVEAAHLEELGLALVSEE